MVSGTRTAILVTLLSAGAVEVTTAQTPTDARRADAATEEVSAHVTETMNAFAAMDLDGLEAGLAADVVAFEMDLEGKPVRLGSRADVMRYAAEMFTELKKMGATLKLDFHSSSCRAASTLAYCTVEFDFNAAMPDGSTLSQPSRNSVVLRKGDDGWKWAHWHSSVASVPAPPAPPPGP